VLKQHLVLNLSFFLNNILHAVVGRTKKDKDPTNVISHHGIVKLIVVRALNHAQITWEDLIELDRPLKIEQLELPQSQIHPEIPPQGIEVV
jgi:hypothetical protein